MKNNYLWFCTSLSVYLFLSVSLLLPDSPPPSSFPFLPPPPQPEAIHQVINISQTFTFGSSLPINRTKLQASTSWLIIFSHNSLYYDIEQERRKYPSWGKNCLGKHNDKSTCQREDT